jgi:predicted CoA-binding protein
MANACELPSAGKKDTELCEMLADTKVMAVVGLSPKPHRDSNIVAKYFQDKGIKIIPVYPREETILGEKVYRSLPEIEEKVDMVVVFRKGADTPPIAKKAVEIGAKYFWMQETVVNDEAVKIAEEGGMKAVQDKCTMVEDKRCQND